MLQIWFSSSLEEAHSSAPPLPLVCCDCDSEWGEGTSVRAGLPPAAANVANRPFSREKMGAWSFQGHLPAKEMEKRGGRVGVKFT